MERAEINFRVATPADVAELSKLIESSVRGLASGDYTVEQLEGALGSAWGIDTQLIHDGCYFVGEHSNVPVACGGWSFRETLYGSDAQVGRVAAPLDPKSEPARIRAFFVHPHWARRGVGRALLELCEREARAHGFRSATLPGERLYRACGYVSEEPRNYPLPGGQSIAFVPMHKLAI